MRRKTSKPYYCDLDYYRNFPSDFLTDPRWRKPDDDDHERLRNDLAAILREPEARQDFDRLVKALRGWVIEVPRDPD